MIGIYLRVSSNGQDTASQEPELEAWANGKEVKYYRDKFTGKTMDRPGFNQLQNDIAKGKIKTVVCWRLDRLGRTASGLMKFLEECQAKKINFVSLRDGIDLSTAAGMLMAGVLSSVARFETEIRAERIKAGLEARKGKLEITNRRRIAKGLPPLEPEKRGRPVGIPDKLTPPVRMAIKQQHAQGVSITQIASMFKVSRPTVYEALKS